MAECAVLLVSLGISAAGEIVVILLKPEPKRHPPVIADFCDNPLGSHVHLKEKEPPLAGVLVFKDKRGVRNDAVLGRFLVSDKVCCFPADAALPLLSTVFQEGSDEVEVGAFPDLDLQGKQEIEEPQAVIHLRRPGALPPEHLEAAAGEIIGLGRLALARNGDVTKVVEEPPRLKRMEQVLRAVPGEA